MPNIPRLAAILVLIFFPGYPLYRHIPELAPGGETGFRKHVLTTDFISEGVATGDVNRDGKIDILAGGYWFEAPAWKRHEIAPARVYDKEKEYSHSFLNHCMDVDMDGWPDLVVVDFPGQYAHWFQNPAGRAEHWKKHVVYDNVGNESPAFVDVDGDGRTDLLCGDTRDRQMIWLKSPSVKGETKWKKYTISGTNAPATDTFSHGLGYGDLNGDGRPDVITREGWWEGPADPKSPQWKFYPAELGEECSQMYAMDVNRDGKMDVISASAHLSGIWWHEQLRDADGTIHWKPHVLSYAFAESHAVELADINGDGHLDIVTGKRNLKKNTWRNNPGTHGPPLLYWFEFDPASEYYWKPHLIDDMSGAGLNLVTKDITGDGRTDIVIANFNGVFLFENTGSAE